MIVTLSALIADVEMRAPSSAPLDRLATAARTADGVAETADALLSHFVDRSRRAGHSWTEIGAALGVTKQAVQKRFTAEHAEPRGWEQFTARARAVVEAGAAEAAAEFGHGYLGTEHLLLGLWSQPGCVAVNALEALGVQRDAVVAGVHARVAPGTAGRGGYTPRAWIAIENSRQVAAELGHNYVGTEHLLLSLLRGVGGLAEEILRDLDVSYDRVRAQVLTELGANR
jgi:ATP-dependent Clp protease ATP-binding subunit ClpA